MKPAMRKSLWAMISKFASAAAGAVGGFLIHVEKVTGHMMFGAAAIWIVLTILIWFSEYQREI